MLTLRRSLSTPNLGEINAIEIKKADDNAIDGRYQQESIGEGCKSSP
jgi:hypothetical protein